MRRWKPRAMRGRRWFHVIATPRATVSFVKWTVNRSPRVLHRCAITIVPLTRHAISDRVYYATYLSIDVLRQCRTTACAPSEEEEAGRQAGACSPRAAARVSGWVCYYWFVFFLRRVSQPRISVKVAPPVCLCMYIYIHRCRVRTPCRWCARSMWSIAHFSRFSRSSRTTRYYM